jgi:hypothetical protein
MGDVADVTRKISEQELKKITGDWDTASAAAQAYVQVVISAGPPKSTPAVNFALSANVTTASAHSFSGTLLRMPQSQAEVQMASLLNVVLDPSRFLFNLCLSTLYLIRSYSPAVRALPRAVLHAAEAQAAFLSASNDKVTPEDKEKVKKALGYVSSSASVSVIKVYFVVPLQRRRRFSTKWLERPRVF